MKNIMSKDKLGTWLVMSLLAFTVLLGGTTQAIARDHDDDWNGYHNQHSNYYYHHHHHRGHWGHRNGVRFWINVG